jgi:predicted metal-dependent enzyme (double-stranded beta helix superfamily)
VEDLKELREGGAGEDAMVEAAPELAKRLVLMKHNWLRPYMCEPHPSDRNSAGIYALHEEPDHSFAVMVVTWLPRDETPPHDHGTWAVIAGLEGVETNHWWKRVDDGRTPGHAEVVRAGSQRIEPATIIAMPGEAIHSVQNDSGAKSVTLHIYGMHVDYTDRHQFDPEKQTITPYRFAGKKQSVTAQ